MVAVAALVLSAGTVAGETIVETHVPIDFAFTNPCTGEEAIGSGFLHVKQTSATEPKNHFSLEVNLESAQAATLSGVRYVWTYQEAFHQIYDSDFAPATFGDQVTLHFTRLGEDGTFVTGDDFYSRGKFVFTINANSIPTASVSEFTSECR